MHFVVSGKVTTADHSHWNYHFLHFLRNWYLKLLTGLYFFGIFVFFFVEIYLNDNDTEKKLFRAFINLGLSWFQFLCFYVKHAALPGINFHVKVQVKNISVNLKCPFYILTLRDYASWRMQHLQHDSYGFRFCFFPLRFSSFVKLFWNTIFSHGFINFVFTHIFIVFYYLIDWGNTAISVDS